MYHNISNKNSNKLVKDYKFIRDIVSYCDGKNSLLDIANHLNCPIWDIYANIERLEKLKIISRKMD